MMIFTSRQFLVNEIIRDIKKLDEAHEQLAMGGLALADKSDEIIAVIRSMEKRITALENKTAGLRGLP